MRIAYHFAKPSHALSDESAGDAVRARALIGGLRELGHEVLVVEAARDKAASTASSAYRGSIKKLLPRSIALAIRDAVRAPMSRRLGASLAEQATSFGAEAILETHDPLSLAGVVAARAAGLPLVVDDVAPRYEAADFAGIGLKPVHGHVFAQLLNTAGRLVAVNEAISHRLLADGAAEEQLARVENGVSLSRFVDAAKGAGERRRALGLAGPVIMFVGSFQLYHRVDLLLDALAAWPGRVRPSVLMIGDGPMRSQFETRAAALQERADIRFMGRIDNAEIPHWLALADIAALPATNDYGNPMKLYEYLAAGAAIVAPDQPTVREVVENDRTGLLFTPGDPAAMARAMAALIDDGARRAALGAAARTAAETHDWRARAARLAEAIAAAPKPAAPKTEAARLKASF